MSSARSCATTRPARAAGRRARRPSRARFQGEPHRGGDARSRHGEHVLIVGPPVHRHLAAVTPGRSARRLAEGPAQHRVQEGRLPAVRLAARDQADIARAWKHILGGVRGFQDLEPALLGRVEELIDFVTQERLTLASWRVVPPPRPPGAGRSCPRRHRATCRGRWGRPHGPGRAGCARCRCSCAFIAIASRSDSSSTFFDARENRAPATTFGRGCRGAVADPSYDLLEVDADAGESRGVLVVQAVDVPRTASVELVVQPLSGRTLGDEHPHGEAVVVPEQRREQMLGPTWLARDSVAIHRPLDQLVHHAW